MRFEPLLKAWRRLDRFLSRSKGRRLRYSMDFVLGRIYVKPAIRRVIAAVFPFHRQPTKWVFLVGCYNSGTTILRDVLGAHPAISGLPREGVVLTGAFPDLQEGGWIRMAYKNKDQWDLPLENAKAVAQEAQRDWAPLWSRKASFFLEKSITHATRMLWLEAAFDEPKFIVIRRNGYCVCEGIRRRASPTGAAKEQIGGSYSMSLVAEQWAAINDRIDDAIPKIKNVHVLSYEDLVADPAKVISEIYTFIGLPESDIKFTDGVLRVVKRHFEIRNMNPSSLERLNTSERNEAAAVFKDQMERYGYDV